MNSTALVTSAPSQSFWIDEEKPLPSQEERLKKISAQLASSLTGSARISANGKTWSFPSPQIAYSLSLGDFQATEGNPLRQKLIDRLELNEALGMIPLERIKTISAAALDCIPLANVQQFPIVAISSEFKLFVSDEKVLKTALDDLPTLNISILAHRLNQIAQEKPTLWQHAKQANETTLSVVDLLSLSSSELTEKADALPEEAFQLLSDEQIKGLDFSRLSTEKISACIEGPFGGKRNIQKRLDILSTSQLDTALQKEVYTVHDHLRPKDIEKITLGRLDEYAMVRIFRNKELIAKIPLPFLQAQISNIPTAILMGLSDNQIQGLDCTNIDVDTLPYIFTLSRPEHKVALLSGPNINILLQKGFTDFLGYISDNQMSLLNMESVPEYYLKNRFPSLKIETLFEGSYSVEAFPRSTKLHHWKRAAGHTIIADGEIPRFLTQRKETLAKNLKLITPDQLAVLKQRGFAQLI